jgi:hypothetical protein
MQLRISTVTGIGLSLLVVERTSSRRSKMLKKLIGIFMVHTSFFDDWCSIVPASVGEMQGDMGEMPQGGT